MVLFGKFIGLNKKNNKINELKEQPEKRGDLLLKILSVCTAVLIWFWVVGFEGQITERKFSSVIINLDNYNELQSRGYSILNEKSGSLYLDVTLEGKSNELNRISAENIYAYIDLNEAQQVGEITFAVKIKEINHAKVSEQSHSNIILYIDRNITKNVPVEGNIVKIAKEAGIEIESFIFTPERVTVSGPEGVISKINKAQVNLDLGSSEPIQRSRTVVEKFIFVDENGEEIRNPYIKSYENTIEVYVPVYAKKEVPLSVEFKYGWYSENNVKVNITPEKIMLKGPPEELSAIENIIIGTIDEKKYETHTTLRMPIPAVQSAQSEVRNVSGIAIAEVEIEFLNMTNKTLTVQSSRIKVSEPKDFIYHIKEESLQVKLFGPAEKIGGISVGKVLVSVDLSGFTEKGNYSVPAEVYVTEENSGVFCVGEYNINVEIY